MSATRYTVRTSDSWTLDVQVLPAQGQRLGVAVVAHAMMVDRRSLDRPAGGGFASCLARHGWEVHLPDLRGRGASGPTVADGASWTYDEIVQLDLPACVEAARDRRPGEFLFLVGHSLSGHGSIAAVASGAYDRPPDGHVLLAANVWTPSLEPSWWRRRKKATAVLCFDLIPRLFGRFPTRLLKMGPVDEASDYVSDIVRIWRSGQWTSRDGRHDYTARMHSVGGPVLSLVGRADRLLAHPVGAQRWSSAVGSGADFRLVGRGCMGLDFDPDHMTLVTDVRSASLWDWTADWMKEQLESAAGHGAPFDDSADRSLDP